MMMNRLVQALFAQRASLLDTQTEATQRMTELEERIAKAQAAMQKKLAAYESRIADLEEQLIVKERENHQLRRANFQLSRKTGEVEGACVVPARELTRCWVSFARVVPVRNTAVLRRSVRAG